jgi:hypothetical protein
VILYKVTYPAAEVIRRDWFSQKRDAISFAQAMYRMSAKDVRVGAVTLPDSKRAMVRLLNQEVGVFVSVPIWASGGMVPGKRRFWRYRAKQR